MILRMIHHVYPIEQDGNSLIRIHSSLTISSGSLQSNRIYQLMLQMIIRRNSSQVTGYVLIKVEDTRPQMISIG